MANKKEVPVSHLTSNHPRVFILQALIFAALALTASFAVFTFFNREQSEMLVKNGELIRTLQAPPEESTEPIEVDESMFEPTPDPSIDPEKLKDLFPQIN